MKILLADDEKLIRTSLISMLEDIAFSTQTIEEAANGIDMVEKLKTFKADIAFVDIQMPGLTGLEAIKMGKNISPATQWIILTGYSEFNYAQKAIELGASGYLLKPVSPEDLHKTLEKAINQKRKSFSQLIGEFEKDMSSYFHGIKTISELGQKYSESTFLNIALIIDSKLEEKERTSHLTLFCNHLQSIIDEKQTQDVRAAFFALSDRELALITAWGLTENQDGEPYSKEFIKKVEEILPLYSDQSFAITMISSGPSKIEEIRMTIQQIKGLAALRTISGIKKRLCLSQLQQLKYDKQLDQLSSMLIKLSENYDSKTPLNYMKLVDDLGSKLSSTDFNKIKENLREFLSCVIPCQLEMNSSAEDWINNLKQCGEILLNGNSNEEDRGQILVDQVIMYVDEHYMNDIGVGQIAQGLHVTPNYLSTLFHKRIGTTFIKYLTRIRILKAKELFADSQNKVQNVAEAVGYYSTRHFTKLFTEQVGCYPSEYQKNLKKKSNKQNQQKVKETSSLRM